MTEPEARSGSTSVTADAVASALAAVPQVRLHATGPVATHLPGRRVGGVRLTDLEAEVHVAVVYPTTVDDAAAAVRAALAPLGLRRVDVVVADVVHPEDLADDGGTAPPPPDHIGGAE